MSLIKKIVLLIVMFFPFIVSASEYSEWSMEKPPQIENIEILTEERYLYYEMVTTNVEYTKYGESTRSNVDMNDYKLTEGIESDIPVEETEYTVVTRKRKALERFYDDVTYVRINHEGASTYGLRIKDISLKNEETNELISFNLDSFNNIVILGTNDYLIYTGGNIMLSLDDTYNAYNLSLNYTVVRDNNDTESKNYSIEYLHTYEDGILPNFSLNKTIDGNESGVLSEIPSTSSDWWIRVDYYDVYYYLVQEKLFKYYDLERKDIGYYTYLEGYLKDETPVTFYSYKVLESENQENKNQESENENKDNELNNNEQTDKNIIDNSYDKNNTSSKTEINSSDNSSNKNTIEYNCEYLTTSSFPLNTEDNITDYSVKLEQEENENETLENEKSNMTNTNSKNLISYNNEKCENCTSYKTFALISLALVLILIALLLIRSLLKRIKEFND